MDFDDISYGSFWSHFEELRKIFLQILAIITIGTVVCFFFYEPLILFFTRPYENSLVILNPIEGFLISLKVCFLTAIVLTSPLWSWRFMQFISPGLYKREKRLVWPFILLSLLFITAGAGFGFFATLPLANAYFLAFNANIGTNLWSLGHYLDYTLFLLLANAVVFEIGAVGIFMIHLGILKAEFLIKKRRHAILGAFILGALLTPPDVLTQVMLAIPLMAIYESLIVYARIRSRVLDGAHG